ncbi:MarR family winged helix-turn-helix transcriptional regulator [Paenarthrobacter sp. RAF54_2]|uniref:MarR family winged helix-turn-helix transcriptional regulator n=1 Tax=Paenarthrobacter sp. RAF54_2 TaxID=3233061 RepID=UPI003F9981C5
MEVQGELKTAQEAANDPRILVFGRLLGAANRLEYLLGRSLEQEAGVSHSLFELLLLVGRAGDTGMPVRDIAQARVLTSGGATRLVQRASAQGLIERRGSMDDRRVQLIHLTPHGEQVLLRAAALHARNVERYVIDPLPVDQAEVFATAIRTLSKNAAKELPTMP